jgi:hypothetical protein
MRAYVNKLRAKPEHVRKQILAGSMITSMMFVGAVWIYGLGYRFHNDVTPEATAADAKPFALFGESISSAYHNITASVGNIPFSPSTTSAPAPQERQIDVIPVERSN